MKKDIVCLIAIVVVFGAVSVAISNGYFIY